MGQPNTVCADWRFAQDTASRNWIENPHTNLSDPGSWMDTNLCIRWLTHNTGDKVEEDGYVFRYRVDAGTWTTVTTSSSYVRAVDSPNFVDGDSTSQELGSGTFDEGYWDDNGVIASYILSNGQESENEHCFQFIGSDCAGHNIELRLEFDTPAALDGYTYSNPSIDFPSALSVEHFRFYTDATPDSSMVALAAEDTAPVLTQALMQNGCARLRIQIANAIASPASGTLNVQFGTDQTNWVNICPEAGTVEEYWIWWEDGAATEGGTITTQFLTGTDESGKYYEDSASVSIGASKSHELDCALYIQWPPPNTNIYFRVTIDGTPITHNVTLYLTTSTAAVRGYAVDKLIPQSDASRSLTGFYSSWPRAYHDGTRYWIFTPSADTPANMDYWNWTGTGAWSSKTSQSFSADLYTNFAGPTAFKVISGTPVVMAFCNIPTDMKVRRATISGTTVTWASEVSLGAATYGGRGHVGIDDGNYWWIGGRNSTTGVWAARATNADTGSGWTSGFNSRKTVADTNVGTIVIAVIGLSSDEALLIWSNQGALKWARVTDAGGFGTVNTLAATANSVDWGWTRSGGYVYIVHTDNTGTGGNWVLKVYNESTQGMSTGTSPGVSGGVGTQDGLPVVSDGDNIYAFQTFNPEGGEHRDIEYKMYAGPGASGTWDSSRTRLTPVAARGNADEMFTMYGSAGGKIVVVFTHGDANIEYQVQTLEYHTIDVGGGQTVTFAATCATATTTPTPPFAVERTFGATAATATTTPAVMLAVERAFTALMATQTTTPTPALSIIKSFAALCATATTTPTAALAVERTFTALCSTQTTTPSVGLAVARTFAALCSTALTTPSVALAIERAFTASMATQTTTPDNVILTLIKTFTALCATQTQTPSVLLEIARTFTALCSTQTTTPSAMLAVERTFAALAATQTTTPDNIMLNKDVPFSALCSTQTTTPDTITLGIIKLFTALCATQTTTTDTAMLAVARTFAALCATQTTTPDAALTLALAFTAVCATQTTTPDTVLLNVVRTFTALIDTQTVTPDNVLLQAIKLFTALCETQTVTPTAVLNVVRTFAASIATQTTTPDNVELLIAGLVTFTALIATQTTTPDTALLQVARTFTALCATQTVTPTVMLNVARAFMASIATQTTTPNDVELLIASIVTFAASIATQTTTPTPLLNVTRAFAALCETQTVTPEALLSVTRTFAASIATQTTTPAAMLNVARTFMASIATQTTTPDDIELLLEAIITFTASIATQTTTPDAALSVVRAFSAACATQTTTPDDVELLFGAIITFAALIATQTTTPDAALAIERTFKAQIGTQTTTPDDVILMLLAEMIAGLVTVLVSSKAPDVSATSKLPSLTITSRQT